MGAARCVQILQLQALVGIQRRPHGAEAEAVGGYVHLKQGTIHQHCLNPLRCIVEHCFRRHQAEHHIVGAVAIHIASGADAPHIPAEAKGSVHRSWQLFEEIQVAIGIEIAVGSCGVEGQIAKTQAESQAPSRGGLRGAEQLLGGGEVVGAGLELARGREAACQGGGLSASVVGGSERELQAARRPGAATE